MGYETEVPPIPDRLTEENMIKDIKTSFKAQPYNILEIPDAMRTRRIAWRQNLNEYRFVWIGNFLRGGLFSGFILFPLGLLFKKTPLQVPTFTVPKMYAWAAYNNKHIYKVRNVKAFKFIVPIWFIVSYTYANSRTSIEGIFDENYSKISSPILPYKN